MSDHLTPYGFTFGPAEITRLGHVEGRGRVLEISTPHARIQVHVTELGRKINVHHLASSPVPDRGAA